MGIPRYLKDNYYNELIKPFEEAKLHKTLFSEIQKSVIKFCRFKVYSKYVKQTGNHHHFRKKLTPYVEPEKYPTYNLTGYRIGDDGTIHFITIKYSRKFSEYSLLANSETCHKVMAGEEPIFVICKTKRLKRMLCYRNRYSRIIKRFMKIHSIINKVYNQRIFPDYIRVLIFERDKYRCKICGKHKSQLDETESLQADHIVSWEDGGKTTYLNGQTLCSTCNKAKHHAKIYRRELTA